eukprot:GHVP01056335.1.p1 GENE.GHVP01056335.1~~GHVP01056335.1.p1  ORF type:complete len:189 (+),score=36.60 GHVP01056335.1:919-1485(+)
MVLKVINFVATTGLVLFVLRLMKILRNQNKEDETDIITRTFNLIGTLENLEIKEMFDMKKRRQEFKEGLNAAFFHKDTICKNDSSTGGKEVCVPNPELDKKNVHISTLIDLYKLESKAIYTLKELDSANKEEYNKYEESIDNELKKEVLDRKEEIKKYNELIAPESLSCDLSRISSFFTDGNKESAPK